MSMDEIKYRAWDKEKEIMWLNINSLVFENGDLIEVILKNDEEDVEWSTPDKVYLLPYLNRKDNNGVEIYKGDIIECDYDEMFNSHKINQPNDNRYRFVIDNINDLDGLNDIIVIGDIYRSPQSFSYRYDHVYTRNRM